MNTDDIKGKLMNLISILFSEKGFDSELIEHVDLIGDLGMDSIAFISMIVEIEAHFNIEVPDDYLIMDHFKNVDAIIKIIANEILRKTNGAEVAENV